MRVLLVFLLGIGNFTMHKAVLESRHPLLGRMPWYFHLLGGRFSLIAEFAMLLGALLMVVQGGTGWAWVYGGYTAFNAVSVWLILTGRV